MISSQSTLLSAKELSEFIKFSPDYINRKLKDRVFIEGIHYVKPFGSRKILYVLEAVIKELNKQEQAEQEAMIIPLANGGVCHG